MTQTFSIAPAGARPLWFLLPFGLLMLALVGVFVRSVYSSKRATFDVTPQGLVLHGDLYGRTIPSSHIVVSEARRVDLKANPELTPSGRRNGVGLPGYRAGWFWLRDGRKALLFVTDVSRLVLIPTRDGYDVLLSVADPDGFLKALRENIPTT